MKRDKHINRSFLKQFVVRFVLMIMLPILCAWWMYEMVLKFYYAENNLATQQINMENSLSLLESSLDATSNAFVALKGNQEILYYIQYQPNKYNMTYGTFKRVNSFCNELKTMTPYLSELKIYCDSPLPIHAGPFHKLELLELEEDFREQLENAGIDDIIWKVGECENGEFPAIYAYKKLYNRDYLSLVGYIEIQLSSQLLQDYFNMVSSLSGDNRSVLTLYHRDKVIYSSESSDFEHTLPAQQDSGYQVDFWKDRYYNYLQIPGLDLEMVCQGKITNVEVLPSANIPSILFSVTLVLLLSLFLLFFSDIVLLSRRITEFSSFIRHSDPEKLTGFAPEKKNVQRADELDVLINTYNTLIQENNSLISRIQKMELFTQNARYHALQGQIHPHFIYGTLETIRMTALQNHDDDAASMIFSLSALIRYSISISSKAVTLQDELEIAGHYLKIQNIRLNDRIDYRFEIEEGLLQLRFPSFILQPILENAVLYGISQTLDDCSLTVKAVETSEQIVLSVANTGRLITRERLQEINDLLSGEDMPESFKGKSNGLALNNIKERLAIFFDGRASVRLEVEDNCTVTRIRIDKVEDSLVRK